MFFKIDSFALIGINAMQIAVEINISNGLPCFSIVGLADKAVIESKDRVKAAIFNSGFQFPNKKIIANLSPADLKKEGSLYDLPLAVCILAASNQIKISFLKDSCFIGELSLNGELKAVRGILSMAEKALRIKKQYFFMPHENSETASVIEGIKAIGCRSLLQCIQILNSDQLIKEMAAEKKEICTKDKIFTIDFSEIRGQQKAKRAAEIAVSGMHNILLAGPPGSGKTMIAERAQTIMPPLSFEESIETAKIYSLSNSRNLSIESCRPFRSPHHSITEIGLIGGGLSPRPGEISLAHRGILFLDEFSEFASKKIEALRQPLENKNIFINRNNVIYKFPCSFMLIAAMNPCFCGYHNDPSLKCVCTKSELDRYWKKISGPVLDRMDMRINVPAINENEYLGFSSCENSEKIKTRTSEAFKIQNERYKNLRINFNSEASPLLVREWIQKDKKLKNIIAEIVRNSLLSARAAASLIKVARTIADLDFSIEIKESHIMEAYQYKNVKFI